MRTARHNDLAKKLEEVLVAFTPRPEQQSHKTLLSFLIKLGRWLIYTFIGSQNKTESKITLTSYYFHW